MIIQLTFSEHQWLTQLQYGDIIMECYTIVVAWMLRLAADSVAHLPVLLSPVVVPGPHSYIGGLSTLSAVSCREDGVPGDDGPSTYISRH